MAGRAEVAAAVRAVLLETWPGRFAPEQLTDGVGLGEDGLGLDSIELVEVLLACEERCGVEVSQDLLEAGPVSLGGVVDHFVAGA